MVAGVLTLLPLAMFIYMYKIEDINTAAFMLAFVFMFIAEMINVAGSLKFYYDSTSCIISEKIVNYKSIKAIIKGFGNPLGRHTIVTFNGERLTLFRDPVNIILANTNLKIANKKQ